MEASPAQRGWALLLMIVAQIGLHTGMTGLRLAAPLLALSLGFPTLSVGLLMGLFALAPIVLALRAGRMADRHGYHRPMRGAIVLSLTGLLVGWVAVLVAGPPPLDGIGAAGWPRDPARLGGFGLLCLAAVLAGAGSNVGLITVQTTAGLRARDAVERRQVFSWLGLAPSLSNALGPVLVGVLIDAAGYAAAIATLLVLPMLAALAVARVPRDPRRPASGPARSATPTWHLLFVPGMRRLLFVNLMLSAAWDLHGFLLPVLGHERGFSAASIGSVLGVFAATVAAVRGVVPVFARHAREHQVLCGAMLWAALVFAAYPLAGSTTEMALCAAGLGVALGLVQPMVMSALHQLAPPGRQGEAIALRSMTINLAGSVLPLLYGLAGGVLGAAALFWLMAAGLGLGSWPARRVGRGGTESGAADGPA